MYDIMYVRKYVHMYMHIRTYMYIYVYIHNVNMIIEMYICIILCNLKCAYNFMQLYVRTLVIDKVTGVTLSCTSVGLTNQCTVLWNVSLSIDTYIHSCIPGLCDTESSPITIIQLTDFNDNAIRISMKYIKRFFKLELRTLQFTTIEMYVVSRI